MFTTAAIPVLTATIWTGSRTVSPWVRLLSMAQPRHARRMSAAPTASKVPGATLEPDDCGAGEDHRRADSGTPTDVFAQHDDADEQRERSLEVQQERARDPAHPLEAEHQEDGRDDPARDDDPGQPAEIRAAQRGFPTPVSPGDEREDGQTGAEVQEPGQHLGAEAVVEEELGDRRTGAEEQRRAQPDQIAGPFSPHLVTVPSPAGSGRRRPGPVRSGTLLSPPEGPEPPARRESSGRG